MSDQGTGRTLRLVVGRAGGGLPLLLAATVAPVIGCSGSTSTGGGAGGHGGATTTATTSETGTGGEAAAGAGGGTTTATGGGTGGAGGSGGTGGSGGGEDLCGPFFIMPFEVPIPPPGVPAQKGQICAIFQDPVVSNTAARVTLTKDSQAPHLVTGMVTVAPALLGDLVGLPTIEPLPDPQGPLTELKVSQIAPATGGFSFHGEWPTPFEVEPNQWAELAVKTTLLLKCDPQGNDTRHVQSITNIHLCVEADGSELLWVSSGDDCYVCEQVMEMAPSPILPVVREDALPLARALDLRLVLLARVGRTLVLLAENDGGAGQQYSWHASAGEVVDVADDVVAWTLPAGGSPQLIQAVVRGGDAVAVASYAYEPGRAA